MESEWLSEAEAVFQSISRAQEEAVDGFSPDLSGVGDRTDEESDVGKRGAALLTPEKICIDWDRFERLFAEILNIVRRWAGVAARNERIAEVHFHEQCRTLLLAEAIGAARSLQERADQFGYDKDVFALAVRRAFAPFLSAYARELKDRFDPEKYLGARCPVCGAEPFMAEFDEEDGRRRLACGLCGTRWRFPRLECPFCGNKDHQMLGFLEVEGASHLAAACRVDVCEACRRYLKTLDRRRTPEPITLELADCLTPELDEATLERGYGLCERTSCS